VPVKLPSLFSLPVETALNQYMRLDPVSFKRLTSLTGKVVAVNLRGMDTIFYLIFGSAGVSVQGEFDGKPDATLIGTPMALARVSIMQDSEDSFFAGEVEIKGDVELGQRLKKILDEIDIDWEEHLSKLTGDVIAHQVGNVVRETRSWGEKTLNSLGRDIAEYLQEESRHLPGRIEMDHFLSGVDEVRSDVDRLEARIKRLQAHMRKGAKRTYNQKDEKQ
jgi:ubiquinone biosynthesis protein UbiJ